MARVPFLNAEDLPEHKDLLKRIVGRRRGKLINVYRTLLHSPPLAESWFNHINQIRWGTKLSGRLREIVIIRLGHLLASKYVLHQHVPNLAEDEGITQEECSALYKWGNSPFFNDAEQSVLAFVDAMAENASIPEEIFSPLREHFSDRQIVELTLMVGAYISHCRVLQALDVDLEPTESAGV